MKSPDLSTFRSTGLIVALAFVSPAVFAGEPAKTAEQSANSASSKIEDYRADASAMNKAEVKAALERLDADIDLLEAKIDSLTDSARKTEATQRLKILKERRKELNREFRQARYDALKSDVRSEWNEIGN